MKKILLFLIGILMLSSVGFAVNCFKDFDGDLWSDGNFLPEEEVLECGAGGSGSNAFAVNYNNGNVMFCTPTYCITLDSPNVFSEYYMAADTLGNLYAKSTSGNVVHCNATTCTDLGFSVSLYDWDFDAGLKVPDVYISPIMPDEFGGAYIADTNRYLLYCTPSGCNYVPDARVQRGSMDADGTGNVFARAYSSSNLLYCSPSGCNNVYSNYNLDDMRIDTYTITSNMDGTAYVLDTNYYLHYCDDTECDIVSEDYRFDDHNIVSSAGNFYGRNINTGRVVYCTPTGGCSDLTNAPFLERLTLVADGIGNAYGNDGGQDPFYCTPTRCDIINDSGVLSESIVSDGIGGIYYVSDEGQFDNGDVYYCFQDSCDILFSSPVYSSPVSGFPGNSYARRFSSVSSTPLIYCTPSGCTDVENSSSAMTSSLSFSGTRDCNTVLTCPDKYYYAGDLIFNDLDCNDDDLDGVDNIFGTRDDAVIMNPLADDWCENGVDEDCDGADDLCAPQCSGIHYNCVSGTPGNQNPGLTQWTWTCTSGSTIWCSENRPPYCGNLIYEPGIGEECDGSSDCTSCTCAVGTTPFGGFCIPDTFCGDGNLDAGEECDDNNLASGDGCSNSCIIEYCSDGITNNGEQCDDGNLFSGDGCSDSCIIEYCDDGIINNNGEQCDQGGNNGNVCIPGYNSPCNYCDNSCNLIFPPYEFCGDGIPNGPEECDGSSDCTSCSCDAGTIPVGGICLPIIDAQCGATHGNCDAGTLDGGSPLETLTEFTWTCLGINTGNPDFCVETKPPYCGDGIVNQLIEVCDDANGVDNDGCSNDCLKECVYISGDTDLVGTTTHKGQTECYWNLEGTWSTEVRFNYGYTTFGCTDSVWSSMVSDFFNLLDSAPMVCLNSSSPTYGFESCSNYSAYGYAYTTWKPIQSSNANSATYGLCRERDIGPENNFGRCTDGFDNDDDGLIDDLDTDCHVDCSDPNDFVLRYSNTSVENSGVTDSQFDYSYYFPLCVDGIETSFVSSVLSCPLGYNSILRYRSLSKSVAPVNASGPANTKICADVQNCYVADTCDATHTPIATLETDSTFGGLTHPGITTATSTKLCCIANETGISFINNGPVDEILCSVISDGFCPSDYENEFGQKIDCGAYEDPDCGFKPLSYLTTTIRKALSLDFAEKTYVITANNTDDALVTVADETDFSGTYDYEFSIVSDIASTFSKTVIRFSTGNSPDVQIDGTVMDPCSGPVVVEAEINANNPQACSYWDGSNNELTVYHKLSNHTLNVTFQYLSYSVMFIFLLVIFAILIPIFVVKKSGISLKVSIKKKGPDVWQTEIKNLAEGEKKLEEYIKQSLNSGISKSKIYAVLISAGWDRTDIDRIFIKVKK